MPTDGPRSPGTVTQVADGDLPWNDPDRVKASDTAYTTFTTGGDGNSSYLLVPTNFGHRIPPGARITEIKCEIECKADGPGMVISVIQAWLAGAAVGDDQAIDQAVPQITPAYLSYAHASWGTAWSPQLLNGSGFGYCVQMNDAETGWLGGYIDHIRSTITYQSSGRLVRSRRGWVTKGYTR